MTAKAHQIVLKAGFQTVVWIGIILCILSPLIFIGVAIHRWFDPNTGPGPLGIAVGLVLGLALVSMAAGAAFSVLLAPVVLASLLPGIFFGRDGVMGIASSELRSRRPSGRVADSSVIVRARRPIHLVLRAQ